MRHPTLILPLKNGVHMDTLETEKEKNPRRDGTHGDNGTLDTLIPGESDAAAHALGDGTRIARPRPSHEKQGGPFQFSDKPLNGQLATEDGRREAVPLGKVHERSRAPSRKVLIGIIPCIDYGVDAAPITIAIRR